MKLPGKHCGHVGQPSPEAVTRTIAPVTAMPPWVRMTASGDDALNPQARHGQQVDQSQEESSDGHGLIVEDRNYST